MNRTESQKHMLGEIELMEFEIKICKRTIEMLSLDNIEYIKIEATTKKPNEKCKKDSVMVGKGYAPILKESLVNHLYKLSEECNDLIISFRKS